MVGLARQQAAGRARIDQAVLGEPLSPRELVVLALLAAGKPNREIAEELVISLDTAKRHVTHILDKLGVANRTQAVTRARELGLLRKTARRPSAPAANATDHSLGSGRGTAGVTGPVVPVERCLMSGHVPPGSRVRPYCTRATQGSRTRPWTPPRAKPRRHRPFQSRACAARAAAARPG